ncbi:hypothetical protein [Sphingomonas sp.]|uniref:hypothetical protein n=1 Tax=Sphingomonas sp. TaxID=28214 RepID=UPI003AFFFF5E
MFFVVAIMGCGDGTDACRDARVLPARYETAAQCNAALPQRLAENSDVDFPTIQADCRLRGAQVAEIKPPRRPG